MPVVPASQLPRTRYKIPNKIDLSICKSQHVQAPSTCYDATDLVTILINDSNPPQKTEMYEVPRELLRWHSSYFAAALDSNSCFKKALGCDLELVEDITVFDAFYCWVSTGKLRDPPGSPGNADADELYLSPWLLPKIWVFADMRGIPALASAAIDMLHERVFAKWTTAINLTNFIYEHSPTSCNLRKYIVDLNTKTKSYIGFKTQMKPELCPAEFLLEVLPILVRNGESCKSISRQAWTRIDRCQWHDHSGPGGKLRVALRK
ncbi:hypothetical protein BKA66DRAFT_567480 [Pyrenochaeta sp. MPI-SDFR-AT-0127]|nr:hypothetical protein BKA66DRAFT_567480 [Pyrenochaeta sp. MPI-SDFR-AT-0127]